VHGCAAQFPRVERVPLPLRLRSHGPEAHLACRARETGWLARCKAPLPRARTIADRGLSLAVARSRNPVQLCRCAATVPSGSAGVC